MKLDFFGVHARTIGLYALLVLWCAIAFSLALAEIATVVALLFWVLWRFREGIRAPRIDRAAVWLLAGYVLLCLLSLFWTEAPKESYRGIFKVLKYAAIFWMSAEIFRENSARKKFQTVFLVFYGILILDGFIQYYAGRDVLRGVILQEASSGGRVSASFKSFGLLASYLVCTIPFLIALGWAYYCSGRKRWYAWTIGFMAAAACLLLFWTRSRGAWLALIAGGILWLFWSRKWKWLLGLGILLAGLYFVLPRSMIIHQNAEGQEQSIVERYYLWDRALNVIKAKPWTGTGINSYVKAHIRYDQTKNWRVRDYYAHNGYLQAAAETGIPSVVFLLAFLGLIFYRGLTSGKPGDKDDGLLLQRSLLLGLANFLVLTVVDTVFHNPQAVTVFWYLLGLQAAYQKTAPS